MLKRKLSPRFGRVWQAMGSVRNRRRPTSVLGLLQRIPSLEIGLNSIEIQLKTSRNNTQITTAIYHTIYTNAETCPIRIGKAKANSYCNKAKTLITKRILLPLFLEGLNFNYFCVLGEIAEGEPIESFGCPEEFELGELLWGWPIGAIIAVLGGSESLAFSHSSTNAK